MSLPPLQIPYATYRLQLPGHLTFSAARQLVPYLAELGVGAAYLSPFFRARKGSTHGYDVVNHAELDPALGSDADFEALATALKKHGLGLVVDIVPNHMCIDDPHNAWWQDVLENGPASAYARYFDIDWNPPKEALRGKVLLPVLGDQFGRVLEDKQLQLVYEDQRFVISYYERRFPTAPRTWAPILQHAAAYVANELAPEEPERMELESIIGALEHIPPRSELGPEAIQKRFREKEVNRGRLARLLEASTAVRQALDRTLVDYNGRRGDLTSFDKLEALLEEQPYRLCYWRVATDEINYRRFFDIDELAAIRVEDPEVFDAVHASILQMVKRGWVTGLRIDHADGLLDPQQYLANLAHAAATALGGEGAVVGAIQSPPLYTVVEKILAPDEVLPAGWLTHGTTGYDFLNLAGGVFVDRRGGYQLRDAYARFTGAWESWVEVLHDSKRAILSASLSAELYTLSHQLDRISEQHRWSRDFTRASLYRALREVVTCFPVYRTYIRPGLEEVREEDRRRILAAVRVAKRRNPAMSPSFFDFIASVLLLDDPEGISDEDRAERRRFVLKFQQVTGPVTAKGTEDTAFYRYYPLASLNEVGGDPSTPGTSVEHFHRCVQEQQAAWPLTMLATGTHDTKRGEDLRARLSVLSEVPDEWEAALRRWQALNAAARGELDGAAVPDANEEHLIYQTLVGTWPIEELDRKAQAAYTERIVRYLDKALREAKLHTSWLNPYEEYDQAVSTFIRTILSDWQAGFVRDLDEFTRSIADAGFVNSLAQTLLKICAPGVPDFYQGVELWDFNLVDPDNRRPVDFALRRKMLAEISARAKDGLPGLATELLQAWPDGRIKLYLIWRGLRLRKERGELVSGRYEPLVVDGPRKNDVCAFARVEGNHWTLCVVPRFTCEAFRAAKQAPRGKQPTGRWVVAEWWQETTVELPPGAPGRFFHALAGDLHESAPGTEGARVVDVGRLLSSFPIALATGEVK